MKNLATTGGNKPAPFTIHKSGAIQLNAQHRFHNAVLFEEFMKHAPMVAWITDEDGYMQYMNPIYLTTYGMSEHDIGKNISEIFPPAIAQEYLLNNLLVINSNAPMEIIEKGITARDEPQTLKIFKFPIKTANKRMVAGWAMDITEQVLLQDELKRNVERHYLVNKATSAAIYDWDIPKKVIYRGQGFQTLFGFTRLTGSLKRNLQHIHSLDLDAVKRVVFASLRNQEVDRWHIEYRYKDSQENYKYVVDKAFIVREEGKAVRVIGAMEDITKQKELQQQLIRQEKNNKHEIVRSIIETQEKERRQLSVELHDNVNQILSSCKLMLEVAKSNPDMSTAMVDKAYSSLQKVISEIRHISHELNPSALLDIGLIEAMHQMIGDVNAPGTIRIHFTHKGDFTNRYLEEEDRIAVYRIVQEKLTNILKHSKAQNAWIDLKMEKGKLTMKMEDDGVGFNPKKIRKGIGLRNIKNRVDYYGGHMQFKTAEGNGCKMEIEIQFN